MYRARTEAPSDDCSSTSAIEPSSSMTRCPFTRLPMSMSSPMVPPMVICRQSVSTHRVWQASQPVHKCNRLPGRRPWSSAPFDDAPVPIIPVGRDRLHRRALRVFERPDLYVESVGSCWISFMLVLTSVSKLHPAPLLEPPHNHRRIVNAMPRQRLSLWLRCTRRCRSTWPIACRAGTLENIDQQTDLHAVAGEEGKLLDHRTPAGVLAGQRLDQP